MRSNIDGDDEAAVEAVVAVVAGGRAQGQRPGRPKARRRLAVLVAALVAVSAPLVSATPALAAVSYPNPPPSFTPVGNDPLYTPAGGRNSRPMLVLLTTFSDLATPSGFDEATWATRAFGAAFPSIAEYYKANSFGGLTLSPAAETCGAANGVAVVNVGSAATYLGPVGAPTTDAHQHRVSLDAANGCVDFARFDRDGNGDVSDNELVVANFRVARDASENCGATRGIDGPPAYDGKTLRTSVAAGTTATDLLTLIHEIGHQALRIRDLYGFGIGSFDLFGPTCGGGAADPHSFNLSAWQKKNLGWITPTVVSRSGYYDIPRADTHPVSFLLYDPERGTNDYFMVENREPTANTYDQSASDKGLAIYRIDDAKYSSGDDNVRPIDIMRPDGATNPVCNGGCYGGNRGDAWDPSDPATPARAMTRTWRDGTPAKVSVRAIGPAGDTVRAYLQVRGPGILVDPFGLRPGIWPGEGNDVTFPVTNTGEATDTFSFTLANLPPGWTAVAESRTLAAGASATAHVRLTPPLGAAVQDFTLTAVGTSSSDGSVTSNAPMIVSVQSRPTALAYTGDRSGDYHHSAAVSAVLSDARFGTPLPGKPVSFQLGPQSVPATPTNAQGVAAASIRLDQTPGVVTVGASFAGDLSYLPARTPAVAFTVNRAATVLAYAGDTHVANGTPATLAARMVEDTGAPIEGRTVDLSLGDGASRQWCSAPTDAAGRAACVIDSVSQPLVGTGQLPVSAAFAGDDFYRPSNANAQVRLLYMSGRAVGATVRITLPLLPALSQSLTDTGAVVTPSASFTMRTGVDLALLAVNVRGSTVSVRTSVAPGTSAATAGVAEARVSLPALPVVVMRAVRSESTTSCAGTAGRLTIEHLAVGGRVLIFQATEVVPNTRIRVGTITLVLNEQSVVAGTDRGLHVNGIRVIVAGTADVIIASTESGIHNCG